MSKENNSGKHTHDGVTWHSHDQEDGTHVHDDHTHEHSHVHDSEHGHAHSHTHDPAEIKKIINRLARAIGHLESVKRMVEDGRDCSDVLIQLAAVRSEITGTGKQLLQEHLNHCIVEAVEEGDLAAVEKMRDAINKFMK